MELVGVEALIDEEIVIHDEGIGLRQLVQRFDGIPEGKLVLVGHDAEVDGAVDVDKQVHADVDDFAGWGGEYHRLEQRLMMKQ